MKFYSRSHLANPALLRSASDHRAQERTKTAELLADIAEIDARKAYVPAGYSSISLYCMEDLGLSEDSARKRIHAARAAREFTIIFDMVADGRLHLSGVVMLAPWLTADNVGELLEAATGKTRSQIQQVLAERFPRSETLPMLEAIPAATASAAESPGGGAAMPAAADQRAPGRVDPPSKVAPVAPARFALYVSIGQSTLDKLQYAQELLSHQIASGDLAAVLDRALDALIPQLERTKFAAADRPRVSRRGSANPRYVPAEVKRAVWARDGGQCTFVGETGHRCSARTLVEYDHIVPVARGGVATVDGMRLRCRAHNQYEAERELGGDFMRQKREAARSIRAAVPLRNGRPAVATCPGASTDVISCLRRLGFRADEARSAAALCDSIPDAPLEERVRVALRSLGKRPQPAPNVGSAA